MADWAMHYLLRANHQGRGRDLAIRRRRHRRLLLDAGRVLMFLGAVILTHMLTTTGGALSCTLDDHYGDAFVALLLWLLGAALAMLSLVAAQFPALADGAVVAIATDMCYYLLRRIPAIRHVQSSSSSSPCSAVE